MALQYGEGGEGQGGWGRSQTAGESRGGDAMRASHPPTAAPTHRGRLTGPRSGDKKQEGAF